MQDNEKGRLIPGVTRLYEKLPLERIGVLLGDNGRVKKEIEVKTRTILTVDSETGSVIIEPAFPETTSLELMKARDIVRAVAYGFSPERAFKLFDEDQILLVIDVRQYVGDKPNHVKRVLGRVIGEDGKARRVLEETTGTYISVYEPYVAIIGDYESANIARTAIEMLVEGRTHATVYKYVEREMFTVRKRRMRELWVKGPELDTGGKERDS
ncbi:Predicted RNA-binding protein (contains KH domains) [Desulfurococcus amylolyticus 1221n]|uniref:Predicted RNA-binding protein (Contains KH domains) n=1 Tax=Desulfurococcus amylolyticus (strain DSM 18924 / JCM 16383 / VKM B-2413 / 1221n) TaxID=490899 RepID=B8D5N3_DESA1|nr:KH domain-containing protein [Desulfurococcus amylolyticus]ACL11414.1 Predicted RNA-binding protein (contains KH domains) [Desulfurococcus amylolyticus 1221n]